MELFQTGVTFLMGVLGLLEGSVLTFYCLINILFFDIRPIQAMMPLAIAIVFGTLYLVSLLIPCKEKLKDKPNRNIR
jgi:hypothetical protein